YSSIEADMLEALPLLPEAEPIPTRPTLPAAYAFLARFYLVLGNYEKVYRYSDSCLLLRHELMDYNGLTSIPQFNREVIFHSSLLYSVLSAVGTIHPEILAAYPENDLRNTELYIYPLNGTKAFWGNYTGIYLRFGGLATDEVYLMRAEALTRLGRWQAALDDLNFLLEHRFLTGTFQPVTANNAAEVLDMVILERRKELLFRGLRQLDLWRLNKEGRNIIVRRSFEGEQFELLPNSPLYTMPIPDQIIDLHPGMEQNPRQ
ncbi:MAG: RagB/SusD family nutrient uptake outer membrane protein, partial [Flavihumibacter sp.]